jgi:hypothetical protein
MSDTGKITEWTDPDWDRFKIWLENLLYNQTIEISFTKVDGSPRTMQATKKTFVINEGIKRKQDREQSRGKTSVKPRPALPAVQDNLLVWDVEVDDWRTIKVRNITNILTLLLKYNKVDLPF